MLVEKRFNTGLVDLSYMEGPPSGAPLVLLHGFAGRWQGFLPVIPPLSMRWHLYAMEFRGHGKSGHVPGRYRPQDYLMDTSAFVERVVVEPAVVFGHSMGALYGLWIASLMPERIRALILGDIPLTKASWAALPDTTESSARERELAASRRSVAELVPLLADIPVPNEDPPLRYGDLPEVDGPALREWAKTITQLDPDVLELHAQGRKSEFWGGFDMDGMLPKICCPVLLLQGNSELGGLMSDADVKHGLSVLPEAYHVKIEHAGHDLGLASWQVAPLMTAVANFLESL
jgi:pimeloyl-ACP methyl ester carboxylesterase